MRRRRNADEVARLLREADRDLAKGLTISNICREQGIAETTYYRWRQRHIPDQVDSDRRCPALELEVELGMIGKAGIGRTMSGQNPAGHRGNDGGMSVHGDPTQHADDFVICCRGTAEAAMTVMRGMMTKLKLTVNETKTRLCHLPDDAFDFLGYTLGWNYDSRPGESYLGPRPSQKKVDRLCRETSELTARRTLLLEVDEQIGRLVRKLDAGKPPVQFDERGVETEHGRNRVTPADEIAGNRENKPRPKAPRPTSTLLLFSVGLSRVRYRYP